MQIKPPALLLIDLQQGLSGPADFYGGNRNHPDAEEKAGQLLALWRNRRWPVYHVRHSSTTAGSPLRPDQPGFAFHEAVRPVDGEPVITKSVNSAFIGTDLLHQLRSAGVETLVVAGLTTQHCVSTSVRMAGNLGFRTYLIEDATAAFPATTPGGETFDADLVHKIALAELHGEFATVVSSDAMLQHLAR